MVKFWDPYGSLTILIISDSSTAVRMPFAFTETEPRRCDAFLSVAGVRDATRKGKGLSARFGRLAPGVRARGSPRQNFSTRWKMIFLIFPRAVYC